MGQQQQQQKATMIEFSFAELFLLIWAVAATAFAHHYKSQAFLSSLFISKLIEDPNLYTKVHKGWLEAEKENNA
jgi:hypothetical protein